MDPTTTASALSQPWWQSGGSPDPNAQQMATALAGSPMDPITGLTPQESMHSGRVMNAIGQALATVGGEKLYSMYDMATYPFHHAYPPSFADQDDPRTQGAIHNASDIAMRAMARSPVRGATGVGPGELKIPNAPEWATPSVEPIGIHAYHGSPHDFDKFDISKIGTGEGAQAYGHGLYFAGNEDVAKSYKNAGPAADARYAEINSQLNSIARQRDELKRSGFYPGNPDWEARKAAYSELGAQYDALMDKRSKIGRMYEVNIKADPEHFLDWDKPLSVHSSKVIDSLDPDAMGLKFKKLDNGYMGFVNEQNRPVGQMQKGGTEEGFRKNWRESLLKSQAGSDLYRRLALSPTEASDAFSKAGIPGIKYKDAGSRGVEQGSHNYVAFNDQLVELLRKYGIAGLLGSGAAAGAASGGGQQQ